MRRPPAMSRPPSHRGAPLKIAGIYAAVGGVWILLSDQLLAMLAPSPASLTRVAMFKGWFFVLATALLIYALVRQVMDRSRRDEDALRRSEWKFRQVMDKAVDSIFLHDLEGNLLDANQAACQSLGYTREELLSKNVFELTGLARRDRHQDMFWAKLGPGGSFRFDDSQLRKDGTSFPVEVSLGALEWEGQRLILATTRDITERKRAEQALRESEGRFRAVLRDIPSVAVQGYGPDGTTQYWNHASEDLYGFTSQEAVGRNLLKLIIPPEMQDDVRQAMAHMAQTGEPIPAAELDLVRKDGSRVSVYSSHAVVLREGKPPELFCLDIDLTQRKQAEEEREELARQWRLALGAANMGWWRYDIPEDQVTLDQRTREIFRLEHHTISGEEAFQQIHPEDLPRVRAAVEATLDPARPQPYRAVYRLRGSGDQPRWVEAHGLVSFQERDGRPQPANLVGTVADITQRMRAEQDLRQSQAAIRGLLDATTDSILLLDRDLRILATNQGVARRLGLELEDLTMQNALEMLPEEVIPQRRAYLERVMRTGQPVRFKDQRGNLHFDNHLYPVTDQEGRVTGIAVFARDITQNVEDEQKQAALERQLRQAQKMEAIGTLAGGIAHDFNNILGAILGFSELALEDAKHGVLSERSLHEVIRATERAKKLVQQILTFSHKVEVDLKPLDLNKEIAQAVLLLGRTIPKMIRLETDLAPDLRAIRANSNQMEQILLNLGTNAADAMPEGGTLRIQTFNAEPNHEFCSACGDQVVGPHVALVVGDSGQGMDSVTREHIFEPFYTTKGPGKGTGLGLSTVHGIVKGHGGHVVCRSTPGRGTTFTIYFPALPSPADAAASVELAPSLPTGDERLLLVDDEQMFLDLGASFLEQVGYQVWKASSGEEALRAFADLDPKPDLVIMDLGMPGMGGQKALSAILELEPRARIMVASGYAAQDQVRQARQAGAVGYVAKPFRRSELLTEIRRVLDQ